MSTDEHKPAFLCPHERIHRDAAGVLWCRECGERVYELEARIPITLEEPTRRRHGIITPCPAPPSSPST